MHAIAEVVIPPCKDIPGIAENVVQGAITKVMDSFKDEKGEADWWDWWKIGGRYTGHKIEARLGEEKLKAFREVLLQRQVTVSSVQCGKPELLPASQIPMVDALWREHFPGTTEQCILFYHARDQYSKNSNYADDICTIRDLPDKLHAERLIVADWKAEPRAWSETFEKLQKEMDREAAWKETHRITPRTVLKVVRMLTREFWNKVEWQNTEWDGNVKTALAKMLQEQATGHHNMLATAINEDYLVVTVDYHN